MNTLSFLKEFLMKGEISPRWASPSNRASSLPYEQPLSYFPTFTNSEILFTKHAFWLIVLDFSRDNIATPVYRTLACLIFSRMFCGCVWKSDDLQLLSYLWILSIPVNSFSSSFDSLSIASIFLLSFPEWNCVSCDLSQWFQWSFSIVS